MSRDNKRHLVGYAVVYRNKPAFTGLDCYLVPVVDGTGCLTGRHKTNGFSLDTAAIWLNKDHAVEALARHPHADSSHEDGRVEEVYEERRLVLGPTANLIDVVKEITEQVNLRAYVKDRVTTGPAAETK